MNGKRLAAIGVAALLAVWLMGVSAAGHAASMVIPVSAAPVAVVADTAGQRVFVVAKTKVSVISTTNDTVLTTFDAPSNPSGAAYSASTDRLFVTSLSSNTVTAFRPGTGTRLGIVTVGRAPYAVAVSDRLKRLWVSNSEADSVSVVDASSLTVTKTVTVGQRPYGLAVDDAAGVVAVANRGSDDVSFVNATTGAVKSSPYIGGGLVDVVTDPRGAGFDVVGTDADMVTVVTAAGNIVHSFPTGTAPYGVTAWTAKKLILTTESLDNKLAVINPACGTAVRLSTGTNPVAVAVVGSKAYVANVDDSSVSALELPTEVPTCTSPKAPVVSGVQPSSGSPNGGTSVTVTGTSLADVTKIDFGGKPGTAVSCRATACTVVSPAGTAVVDVTAVNSVGRSATSSADRFAYLIGVPGPVKLPKNTLVRNGGFEPPGSEQIDSFDTIDSADVAKLGAGWVMSAKSSVDLAGPGADQAAEGTQFVDLDGNNNNNTTQTELRQDISTRAGRAYRVSFQLAGNPNGDPPIKTVTVVFGAVERDFTFDASQSTTGVLGWTAKTFTVTACKDTTRLRLRSTTVGTRGPLIDAVAVVDAGPGQSCQTTSPSPSPTVSPSTTPTATLSPSGSHTNIATPTPIPSTSPGGLPDTGAWGAVPLLAGGAMAVLVGGILVWWAHRRRTDSR